MAALPLFGVSVVAALVFLLLAPPSGPTSIEDLVDHTGPSDIMVQTASNFRLIREGKMKPALVTCSPESMYGYLHAQHLPFEARVQPMERCDGYSAFVDDFQGVRLAHVVYAMGDDLVYVYQVRKDDALVDGGHVSMPIAGRNAVMNTGWYTDPKHPQCNVVVWEEEGTVCAATSTMSKERLVALLASR